MGGLRGDCMSRTITCKDCGDNFHFKTSEEEFYKEKGFTTPIRCKPCREKKKAEREQYEQSHREGGR